MSKTCPAAPAYYCATNQDCQDAAASSTGQWTLDKNFDWKLALRQTAATTKTALCVPGDQTGCMNCYNPKL